MRITLSAISKILQLIKPGEVFRIEATAIPFAGQHVDLFPDSSGRHDDLVICDTPKVVADLTSVTLLADRVIDYSFQTEEFIISNRGNE